MKRGVRGMRKLLERLTEWLIGVLDRGLSAEAKAKIIRAAEKQLKKEIKSES